MVIIMPKQKYAIEISITGKEIKVSHDDVSISVNITRSHLELSGKQGHQFIFRSTNQTKTIKRWKSVIGCLSVALNEIEKQRKLLK